jgi:thiamine-phosphate diphosphorylase
VTRLPPLLVLTDRVAAAARGRTLAETVAAAAAGEPAAVCVVLREKDLAPAERRKLGSEVAAAIGPDVTLLVASDAPLAAELGAAGVHLAAHDPSPLPAPTVVGRSCHDHAELQTAVGEGVDYVTVSPVYPTASKPGYGPALGGEGLRALAALPDAPPVYALGGINSSRVPECLATGAVGVAVMGAVMAAEDPEGAVAALLAALDQSSRVKEVRG